MPYHPKLAEILDTPEIRKIKSLDLPTQREIFSKITLDIIKDIPRPDIKETDIDLGNDSFLRYYQPKQHSDKAVLFMHGGGWCLGSVETYDNVCRYLCDNGDFHVFSLEYSLAPEHRFPIAVNQSLYAYDWLFENAKNFNINAKNIFVMGDSAGGNFATIICHENQQKMPKAQILFYPAVDAYNKYPSNKKFDEHKYHLTLNWCEMFLKAYVGENSSDIKN